MVKRCAWLEVRKTASAHREWWIFIGDLIELEVTADDVVGWMVECGCMIARLRCSCGVRSRALGDFLVPVRGEGSTVRIEGLRLKNAVHRGVFILPTGDDRYRVGATFSWDHVWSGPTDEARRWLWTIGSYRFASRRGGEHRAGVRPASCDRLLVLGAHQRALGPPERLWVRAVYCLHRGSAILCPGICSMARNSMPKWTRGVERFGIGFSSRLTRAAERPRHL